LNDKIRDGTKHEADLIAQIKELEYKIGNAEEYKKNEMAKVAKELKVKQKELTDHNRQHGGTGPSPLELARYVNCSLFHTFSFV
jgi:hypothetical protein